MIVVNPFSWTIVPFHDCISSLVNSLRYENVISVMCNGRWIMKDQKILKVDEEKWNIQSPLGFRSGVRAPKLTRSSRKAGQQGSCLWMVHFFHQSGMLPVWPA